MRRGSFWQYAGLLALLLMLPSCATAVLWDWAGEEELPGQLSGILSDGQGGDMVIYRYADTAGIPGGTVGVRIPAEWRSFPLRSLAYSPGGDAMALAEPLPQVTAVSLPPPGGERGIRLIDYKTTIGRQPVAFAPGERPYGFVPLMTDSGEVIHELYGYEFERQQWVRLATVSLGGYEMDPAKMVTGMALTPVTMVLDLVLITAVVCAIGAGGGGGNLGGFDVGGGGASEPRPIYVSERNQYWRSLMTAGPPVGR